MQPVKLVIPGDFWDCQIYRGRLYLWKTNGDLVVLNWDQMVDSLIRDENDRLAVTCAFARGDYLYGARWSLVFSDSEFVSLLRRKFSQIVGKKWLVSTKLLMRCQFGVQQNPFKELPTDTDIYSSVLYGITDDGLWSATAHRSDRKYPVSSLPKRMWDCPLFSLKAGRGGRLALAAGAEGLYEYHLTSPSPTLPDWEPGAWEPGEWQPTGFGIENNNATLDDIPQGMGLERVGEHIVHISGSHSSVAHWSFASIYSSSYVTEGYMAAFGWEGPPGERKRVFRKLIPQSLIFKGEGFSWGAYEKLYQASDHSIDVVTFQQKRVGGEDEEQAFQFLNRIPLPQGCGRVIGAGVTTFGTVVECENGLTILTSDGQSYTIPGPVGRWRVYPRSQRYENHLHVICEDRLEVYSFNHDYFVDQETKLAGLRYSSGEVSWLGRADF